jgi:predicted amidohydrolase
VVALRVAAYQAPLLPGGSMAALDLIGDRVRWCEAEDVDLLLCPEGVLGGLADDVERPAEIAIRAQDLAATLRPLASARVTTVVGFTEAADDRLYNAAAVCREGEVVGLYRKRHPARRVSVYSAGTESPVFTIGDARFGLMICNDTNFPDLADELVARGARLLLVPSNNGLRSEIADVVGLTRAVDVETARRCGVPVVRADVAGRTDGRVALGASAIIDARGEVVRAGTRLAEDLLVADLEV